MKKVLKTLLMYIFVFIILIGIYMGTMILSSLIPSSLMEDNVRKSSEVLLKEGEKVTFDLKYKKSYIFTFTDALMINTAYSVDSKHPVESFLLARKNYVPNQTKLVNIDSQYHLGANEKYRDKYGNLYQTKELYGLMHGDNIEDSYEYARYWHGYLTILRPLLAIFDYSAIRIVLFIAVVISMIIMFVLICKKINIISAFSYVIGLLLVNILVTTKSINEILIFLVAIISTIVLLIKNEKIKNIGIYFFIVGSVSSFIDLLTAPVVTLGLTTITYFLLLQTREEKADLKKYILDMLNIGISWVLGYAITWGFKWLIVQVFFNRPIITQAITQVAFRSNLKRSVLNVIIENFKFLSNPTIIFTGALCLIYLIVITIKNAKQQINIAETLKKCVPYFITFTFPIVWIFVAKQHSLIHAFFVNRIFVISIISLFIISTKIFEGVKK